MDICGASLSDNYRHVAAFFPTDRRESRVSASAHGEYLFGGSLRNKIWRVGSFCNIIHTKYDRGRDNISLSRINDWRMAFRVLVS